MIYIAKIIEKKEEEKLKEENECLMKVLEFLRDYKMTDPIDFLKKTKIGQLIKYINTNINDEALSIQKLRRLSHHSAVSKNKIKIIYYLILSIFNCYFIKKIQK